MTGLAAETVRRSLRGRRALGNLRRMHIGRIAWRIVALVLLALLAASFAAWLFLRPAAPPVTPAQPPAREVFHASKPLRVVVGTPNGQVTDIAWLEYELRQLLNRGKMRVAPIDAGAAAFVLDIAADPQGAALKLIAPDRVVERELHIAFEGNDRFATMRAFAQQLPAFLRAPPGSQAWLGLLGTADAKAYDSYVDAALSLLGPAGEGFTRPSAGIQHSHVVERLESVTHAQPSFARAWAALAVAYLSLGGADQTSLAQLAKSSAERALALDDDIAEAHAALGLVHMQRGEWIAAREQFDRALALDANSAPAVEGSGCLAVDAGRLAAARPQVERAIALQAGNLGALDCLAYVRTTGDEPSGAKADPLPGPAARAQALAALLAGDHESAGRYLHSSVPEEEFERWAGPLLRAASDRSRVPDALQAITVAANEGKIDATTEILCGVALRRAEFVFNRMARLQRQRESVPLRILWIRETGFLRKHPRFEQIVNAAGLPSFWQEYGLPDACATEPALYGCKIRSRPAASPKAE